MYMLKKSELSINPRKKIIFAYCEFFCAVNIAQVCSDQLFNVINDILEFSKLEENKITLDSRPLSLYAVVEDSLQVC